MPAPAPAFREGVNVLLARTEEIQKVHAHVFAGLADAQKDQIFLNCFRCKRSRTIFRSFANALTACSALLLFQGMPSKLRNVNSLFRFFSNRCLHLRATSL